jgi:DUF4097 and DUF4098 domain-containing protein YvlB
MSWLYTLVFAGLLFSSNTDTAKIDHYCNLDTAASVPAAQQDETERIEKTFPLNADGRVNVSNVNGSITVSAWDRNEVALVAVKTADSKDHLADVDVKIDARPDYFSVEADYGDSRNRSDWKNHGKLSVDFDLKVPRTAVLNEIENVNGTVSVSKFTNSVKASTVNGDVRATNLRGTANLSTVNGEVTADYDQLEAGTKISLETVNGKVGIIIPSDSVATIQAESLNGEITNDFGLPVRKGKYIGRDLKGRLGSVEASPKIATIKLDSVNGGLSLKRRNDGRPVSPAVNLLSKGSDDEDWDSDKDDENPPSAAEVARMNREAERATANAQRQAARDVQREMVKIRPEMAQVNTDTTKMVEKTLKDVNVQVKDSIKAQTEALVALRDAMYLPGVPHVSTKSDSIPVKGTPMVTIDAGGCSVRVHGWDKQEVQYAVTQYDNSRNSTPLQITENHNDSAVNIKITNNDPDRPSKDPLTHIDVFVPRKSNLKIISNGEIRLEGVSGDLDITGSNEPVNIRDSQGKLSITNCDGRVRVIGFEGDVTARTSDGDVYLEGNFSKLTAKAQDGNFTVTLPANTNADISANTDLETDGFDIPKRGSNSWRMGSGGSKFDFNLGDGQLLIRNSTVLSQN